MSLWWNYIYGYKIIFMKFLWNFFPKYQLVYLFIRKLDHLFFFTLAELKLGINLKQKYIIYIYIYIYI